ncbi:hypothetical protein GFL93_12835 [Rhizobium leguminosarum bv. viciae]|uniref:hypothetical protein n=1 Tax=Rhizobium TaxID=379 RepID=UPI001441139A|nr:hypothetical protein [Rhizobium leguminosarum]NKK06747.1 hypothetical protein [Rhizobium leguminosarum bv. viciae]
MAILEAVFANKAGQTPQEVERRRRMAQALVEAGAGGKPPSSGLELAGRLAMTLTGQYQAGKAERQDATNRASASSLLAKTLLGEDPYSPTGGASGSPVPMTGAAAEVQQPSSGSSANPDIAATEAYIREAATKRGIDPETAVKVARSEGLAPGVWQSNVMNGGKRETSYGPFQLLVGGGLGDKFQKVYGKSPSDPSTLNQQIDFALDEAAQGGWSPWYGAAKVGVGSRTGLQNARALGYQQPQQVASLDPSAGMGTPSPIQPPPVNAAAPSPTPGYSDPRVATEGRAPMQGPTQPAPALPPPTTVASAPPVASVPQQQPASLMSSAVPGQAPSAPSLPQMVAQTSPRKRAQIAALLQNPYTQEAGQQMLMQEYERQQQAQNLILKQQLEQNDPKYRQDLEKGGIELENLRNPRIGPADQARLDLERQKFEADRNKPTEVNGRLVGPDGKVVYDSPMSAADEARLKLDRDKFEAEVQKGQWEKMTDGRLFNKTTGDIKDAPPPLPGSVTPKFDDISGMRKEIQQLPSYKNLAAAAPIYKAMAETAGRDSKASDLNLVYGLGKIMDPTSVVREGEMVMVKNTASLPDWLQGAIASLNGGAALTPETRQAIMTEAYGRVKGYNDEFQQNMGQYQGIVQRNGINPADVIPDVDKFDPWTPPAAAPGTTPAPTDEPVPEGMDPNVWKFVPPEDRKLWQK